MHFIAFIHVCHAFHGKDLSLHVIRSSFVDILCFCSVLCLLSLCASVNMCFVITCWERADLTSWLSFVVSNCEFVTFPLVSLVRCGT